jgi:hypothetical protein
MTPYAVFLHRIKEEKLDCCGQHTLVGQDQSPHVKTLRWEGALGSVRADPNASCQRNQEARGNRFSRGRIGRSVRWTSSVTTLTASSNTAAGSTKAAQLRPARGRRESLSRPCARLRIPVWRRLIKRRPLAARSNGRTHKPSPCHSAPPAMRSEAQSKAWTYSPNGLLSISLALGDLRGAVAMAAR